VINATPQQREEFHYRRVSLLMEMSFRKKEPH